MKAFVIDVDGCLTDGRMYYTDEGKTMKAFGADDHDALKLLRPHIKILFVTGDQLGFKITQKRIWDMGFQVELVPMKDRLEWIKERFPLKETIYMGDGILDGYIFNEVGYSICPADGFYKTRQQANYVCEHSGGHRAVAEACTHIEEAKLV